VHLVLFFVGMLCLNHKTLSIVVSAVLTSESQWNCSRETVWWRLTATHPCQWAKWASQEKNEGNDLINDRFDDGEHLWISTILTAEGCQWQKCVLCIGALAVAGWAGSVRSEMLRWEVGVAGWARSLHSKQLGATAGVR